MTRKRNQMQDREVTFGYCQNAAKTIHNDFCVNNRLTIGTPSVFE